MIKVIDNETKLNNQMFSFVNFRYDSVVYLNTPLSNFKPELLSVIVSKLLEFEAHLMYSFDNINWSKDFKLSVNKTMDNDVIEYIERVINFRDIGYFPEIWIAIKFTKKEEFYQPDTIHFDEYLPDSDIPQVDFIGIEYNGKMNVMDIDLTAKTYQITNNRFPKWTIYDNVNVMINKWYDDIEGVQNIVGHPCIYFKTRAKTISHSLQTADEKDVISIKRFKVTFPSNILPKDTMVYSEYDYAMMEESYAEIGWRKFRRLFGEKAIPEKDDILFLPILNKLFRVTHVEPEEDKKFMGKIGWFNVYLNKYADSDTVNIDAEMHNILNRFDDDFNEEMLDSLDEFLEDTDYTRQEIFAKTDSEKKKVTQNYSNKLTDTSTFVDMKETDSIRKNYNKRMDIVTVNPSQNTFPVQMYDCSAVERKRLGFEYDLHYLQKLSDLDLYPKEEILFSFNFVSTGRHTAPIFEILSDGLPLISISLIKDKLGISTQKDILNIVEFDHSLMQNEYYQINFIFKQRTIIIQVFLLRDKDKKLLYKDLYIEKEDIFIPSKTIVDGLIVFGGNYLIGEPTLNIDNFNILTDYVNPVMEFRSFGN